MAGKYIFQKEEKPLYFGYKEADQKTIGSLFMKNAQNDDEFLKNAPLVIFKKVCGLQSRSSTENSANQHHLQKLR